MYARLVAENGQYIAAEFHYLMALAAMQSAVEAGNPLVLLARQVFPCVSLSVEVCIREREDTREGTVVLRVWQRLNFHTRIFALQELGDLYVSQVGRKDSQKVDAALQSAAVEVCVHARMLACDFTSCACVRFSRSLTRTQHPFLFLFPDIRVHPRRRRKGKERTQPDRRCSCPFEGGRKTSGLCGRSRFPTHNPVRLPRSVSDPAVCGDMASANGR